MPIGLFVSLVLLANNIRDIGYDGSVKTRTIAVVLGPKSAAKLYAVLIAAAYLFVGVGVIARGLPLWSLVVLLTIPEARRLVRMFDGPIPDNADPRTAALALQFAILYMASLVAQIFLPLSFPI
jgi:1,4-dihydroxy-2-naphthoate octaprenyltransferase